LVRLPRSNAKTKQAIPSIPRAQIWSKWLLYMCAYTRNSRRTIVRTVSRKFRGNDIPIASSVTTIDYPLWSTHRSCWGIRFRPQECSVSSSSMHLHIRGQAASWVSYISHRPPRGTRTYHITISLLFTCHRQRLTADQRTLSDTSKTSVSDQVAVISSRPYLLRRAELGDSTVQHVQVVEEINSCSSEYDDAS